MPPDDMLAALGSPSEEAPEESGPMMSEAPLDDFGAAISEAFPDNAWTPEKLDAMKEAIRICFEQDKAGGYGGEAGGGGGDEGLALVFGAPKKKS